VCVCVCVCVCECILWARREGGGGKRTKKQENDGVDNQMPQAQWSAQAQSHGLVSEVCCDTPSITVVTTVLNSIPLYTIET
jgi:hypothetical protein